MNINMSVVCDDCSRQTNCRVGMSNRDIQPVRFSCRGCGAIIALDFTVKGADGLDNRALLAMLSGKAPRVARNETGVSYKITGAYEVALEGKFDETLDFVDLHLDFPVRFGKYVMGNTPYMAAVGRTGPEETQFHRLRLHLINERYKSFPLVARVIDLYGKGHYGPFREFARKRLKVKVASNDLKDIDQALYDIIDSSVHPFMMPDDPEENSGLFKRNIATLLADRREQTLSFMQELTEKKFLDHLHKDCLKIYRPIFDAELPLRPALFLDLDRSYVAGTMAMRVSSQDFEQYREVYKDMSEVLSRQLVLVAGLNNLLKRGDHNAFARRLSKADRDLAPASLDRYADVALGNKLLDLDEPWYAIDPSAVDNELRNAIAHNKIEYEDVGQAITYYPKLEGMEREKKLQIQLLDYMWRLLSLFRQVHRLHILTRCMRHAVGSALLRG